MTVLVFEGPDGGGKSTAIKYVQDNFGLRVLERASSSVDGPIPDLAGWVEKFFHNWDNQQYTMCDRHPLISELVYGPIVHGRLADRFEDPYWLRSHMQEFRSKCVIVWCIPPLASVAKNVIRSEIPQMPGVVENIEAIYWAYHGMRAAVSGARSTTFDFTTSDSRPHLHRYIDWVLTHNI